MRNGNSDPYSHSSGISSSNSSSGIGVSHFQWVSGYGVAVTDRECKAYTPQGGFVGNSDFYPGFDHMTNLTAIPKHLVQITVQEKENGRNTALTALVDGKKEINCTYKLNKEGPFTIEIKGTVTLEDPKAAGQ